MLLSWRPPAISLTARSWPGIWPGKVILFGVGASIVAVLVLVPLASLVRHVAGKQLGGFWESLSSPEAVSSLLFAAALAAAAALINAVLGTVVASTLVRHDLPLKGFLDSLIGLPAAVPAGVAGLTLLILYGPLGILGERFHGAGSRDVLVFGGVLTVHVLMTMHYVARAVGPALQEVGGSREEVAMTVGANDTQILLNVVLPSIRATLISGSIVTFARSLGELGATIIVSGQLALRTDSASMFIFSGFSRGDIGAASSMSVVLVVISVAMVFGLKLVVGMTRKGRGPSVWRDIS